MNNSNKTHTIEPKRGFEMGVLRETNTEYQTGNMMNTAEPRRQNFRRGDSGLSGKSGSNNRKGAVAPPSLNNYKPHNGGRDDSR